MENVTIVKSNIEPNKEHVWLHNGKLKAFGSSGWEDVGLSKEELEDVNSIDSIKESIEDNKAAIDSLNNNKQDKLTASDDINIDENNVITVTDLAKKQLFIDIWNEQCGSKGRYNPETGYFELNGLTDITYEQAIAINNAGKIKGVYTDGYYLRRNIRTCYLVDTTTNAASNVFDSCYMLELVAFLNKTVIDYACFWACYRLHTILGTLIIRKNRGSNFHNCYALKNVQIILQKTFTLLNLQHSPLITYNSFKFMVDNAEVNDATGQIKVHPDVYAKLTGDTTNAVAAALTPEEVTQWQQLVTDATAKNITFITTE